MIDEEKFLSPQTTDYRDNEKSTKFEQEISVLTNKPKTTMGIEEFVLERAKRIGEKKGMEKGEKKGIEAQKTAFVKTLLSQTDFDDAKIANLSSVTLNFVQKIRQQL